MAKPKVYKTNKKYKCPYCDLRLDRNSLINHLDKNHEDLMPEGYSAVRVAYETVNGKDHNTCMICGRNVYEWDDHVNRYKNLCDDPRCQKKVTEIAQGRIMKVYGVSNLMSDPEYRKTQMEKLLNGRKISGKYTFSDGGVHTYTGQNEKKTLEFMDSLGISSKDIRTPGPILEYDYKGQKHLWLTDIYYIPANLVIEVKDGGDNPNNRPMPDYRAKQVEKEKMITRLGEFNYLRLTNNDFKQLLEILAEIKKEYLVHKNPVTKFRINEEVGGLPPQHGTMPDVYVLPCGLKSVFDNNGDDDNLQVVTYASFFPEVGLYGFLKDNKIKFGTYAEFSKTYVAGPTRLKMTDPGEFLRISKTLTEMAKKETPADEKTIIETVMGRKILSLEEALLYDKFMYYDIHEAEMYNNLMMSSVFREAEEYTDAIMRNDVKVVGNVIITQTPSGYYAHTPKDYYLGSEVYETIDDIPDPVIDLMNNLYAKNRGVTDEE